jgi:CBS domain containing-hemolysin-like protein
MTEAAFLAVNKVRLRHLMQRGSPSAKLVYHLLTRLDRLIATVLVGNNVVNITFSVLGTMVLINLFGEQAGAVLATVLITVVLLVFGEITPKLFAAGHADRVVMFLARPLQGLIRLMSPLVWLFTMVSHSLIRVVGGHRLKRSPLVTEEELKVMMEMGREAGVLEEGELRMLHRIFEFSDSVVREVMVPREEIAAIDLSAKPDEVLDVLIEEGHARIPVYRGSVDQVVGVVYARDVLAMARHGGLFVLADLIRPVSTVRETKRVAELLTEFQLEKTQIAVVKDAHGHTVGLVTIEDLLEEIVGEIQEDAPRSKS